MLALSVFSEEEISLSNDEDIVNEVKELENSGSECTNATLDSNANDIASEQEAADEKEIGNSVDHEDVDNYKEPTFQNKHEKSHSQELRTILESASLLDEQLYSPNILHLWRSGACTSLYEVKEDDEEFVLLCTL